MYFPEPIQISAIYIHEINRPGVTKVGGGVHAGKLPLAGGRWGVGSGQRLAAAQARRCCQAHIDRFTPPSLASTFGVR